MDSLHHLDAARAYYCKKLNVKCSALTIDFWPQFAHDLLMHPKFGLISTCESPATRAAGELYERWIKSGKKPEEQAWKEVFIMADIESDRAKCNPQFSAALAVYNAVHGEYDSEIIIGVESFIKHAVTAKAGNSKAGNSKETAVLRQHWAHFKSLQPKSNIVSMEF